MLLLACFLSGCAALVYQILWTRHVGLLLGSTVEAVATVVATFMAGLAAGNALAARSVDARPRQSLARLYAGLELGIALLSIVAPIELGLFEPWLSRLYHDGSPTALFGIARVLISVATLLPPTLLMGATLPVLAALAAPARARAARDAGLLYAANTAGALLGCLGGALVLLPALGMRNAALVAGVLNLAAAAIVLSRPLTAAAQPGGVETGPSVEAEDARPNEKRARRSERRARKTEPAAKGPDAADEAAPHAALALGLAALFGFAGLANEVAWTRALILLIGPTAYAFAFILAAVIAGLALGSLAAGLALPRLRRQALSIALLLVAGGGLGVWVVHAIGAAVVPIGEFVHRNADDMDRLLRTQLLFACALLLPPMAVSGAAFPLLLRLFQDGGRGVGRSVGLLLASNTLGAIVGSLAAGFLLLPRLGLERTLLAVAVLQAAAGLLLLLARPTRGRAALAACCTAAVGLAFAARAPWDPELLAGGVYKYAAYAGAADVEDTIRAGTLLYYKEGRAATVSVKRLGGTTSVAVDGKVDATSSGDMLTQRLLAHLPLLLHPAPRSALVIGLGSGVTAGSALTHPLASVDAVEISEEVTLAAARFFPRANHDALRDPRLRLILGDGRNHVRLARRRYDVIISEPSNPWMAGVSALFTRDFFRLARERLEPGGVFCQWAHVYNMRDADLRTVFGGFVDAFPGAALFLVNEGDVLLIGGAAGGPSFEPSALAARMASGRVRDDLAEVGVRSPFGFASLLTLPPAALAAYVAGAERHTDDRPVLEFRAPRALHANTGQQNAERLIALAQDAPRPEPWRALTAAPTAAELVERAGMLERSEGFVWAYRLFERAAQQQPTLQALEGMVRCALRVGRQRDAEAAVRQLTPRAPADAQTALALLYDNEGKLKEALGELQAALEREPRHVRALLLAAEIQEQLGDLDAMARLAAEALRARPDDPEAEAYLASARLARGELDAAAVAADRILARAPGEVRALQVAAIARAQKGDREAARRLFERLVESEPDAAGHLVNFGVFELAGQDYRAAARLFEAALDLDPQRDTAARGLAEAARALGDPRLEARAQRRPAS